MKKLKDTWRKKNPTQKKEFVIRILKQSLFAVICMLIGSVIGSRVVSKLFLFLAIPIGFTFLGYYLGKKSNQNTVENKTTKPAQTTKK